MIRSVLTISMLLLPQALASAQEDGDRSIDQFLCKDVMRDSGANRDVAVAFLHGYLLGQDKAARFNLGRVQRQTEAFVERCLDNPNQKAIEEMAQVKAGPR